MNVLRFLNKAHHYLQSFVGFVVFLFVLLRPPPSTLLPNLPHTGHKLSVVILPSSTTYNLSHLVMNAGIPIITGECDCVRIREKKERIMPVVCSPSSPKLLI